MTDVAASMLAACVRDEQCARRVPDDAEAAAVRARLRVLAREADVQIRTARMGDSVVVVLAEAAVWRADAAEMRRLLTPPDPPPTGR